MTKSNENLLDVDAGQQSVSVETSMAPYLLMNGALLFALNYTLEKILANTAGVFFLLTHNFSSYWIHFIVSLIAFFFVPFVISRRLMKADQKGERSLRKFTLRLVISVLVVVGGAFLTNYWMNSVFESVFNRHQGFLSTRAQTDLLEIFNYLLFVIRPVLTVLAIWFGARSLQGKRNKE